MDKKFSLIMAICQKQVIVHEAELANRFLFYCTYFHFPGIADEMSYLEDIFFHFKKRQVSRIANTVPREALWSEWVVLRCRNAKIIPHSGLP